MKTRLLIAVPALLAVVALAGALGPSPDPAGAQQPADSSTDSVTVNGVGTVKSVPDEANFSFGVETRARDRPGRDCGERGADGEADRRAPPGGCP